MSQTVLLRHQTTELVLSCNGGGIVSLHRDGQPLMCAPPRHPHLACFPMVPFCSRIDQGRFNIAGRSIQLAPNFLPEPHTIHGFGWQAKWQTQSTSETECTLCFDHDQLVSATTRWPWIFSAEQRFELVEQGLVITLTLKNLSDRVMPAGMGLHPHFPLSAMAADGDDPTQINLLARSRIRMGADFLPSAIDVYDGRFGNLLADRPWQTRAIDDVFGYGSGLAQICWLGRPWSLSIEPDPALPHWIVYAPRGEGFICIEPISHFPNAINAHPTLPQAHGGLVQLAPDEVWSTRSMFRVTPFVD